MIIRNVTLSCDFFKFVIANYDSVEDNDIRYLKIEQQDIYTSGFPDSFVHENTAINQVWWDNTQIDYDYIGQQLGIKVETISSIRQLPGRILPAHKDKFIQLKKKYGSINSKIVRANIFLEDWKMGHYLEYNSIAVHHWSRGQGIMWDDSVVHLSANAGFESKYTLQVSGILL